MSVPTLQRAGVQPRLATALGLSGALLGCDAGIDIPLPALALGEPVHVQETRSSAGSDLNLYNASAVVVATTGLAILDAGNHRVVHVDTTFTPFRFTGAKGAGPAEFAFPVDIAHANDTLVVSDLGNARFTVLDATAGVEIRSVAAGGEPRTFGWLHDGSFVAPARSPDFYMVRTSAAGEPPIGFGRRLRELPAAAEPSALVAGCGSGVHVLDNEHGVLLRYNIAGELQSAYLIPEPYRRSMLRQRDDIVRRFTKRGFRGVRLSLAKQLAALDCSHAVLLVAHDEVFGLLIDYTTAAVRPLLLPHADPVRTRLRHATAIAHGANDLFLISDDEVYSYAYR